MAAKGKKRSAKKADGKDKKVAVKSRSAEATKIIPISELNISKPEDGKDAVIDEPHISIPTDVGAVYRLGPETPANVLLPAQPAFGFKLGSLDTYTTVPLRLKDDPEALALGWRIEIHGLVDVQALGFDILSDVTMGRRDKDSDDTLIDLEPYKAVTLGVSRKHAMLRPTKRALFLLDLKSANGTFHNSMRMNSSIVRAIGDGDTISLGNLTFQIRIIDRPQRTQSNADLTATK